MALTGVAPAAKMVNILDTAHSGPCFQPPAPPSNLTDPSHGTIAQAVPSLLSPMISAAVKSAVHNGIEQLRKELGEHSHRISEMEQRISSLQNIPCGKKSD